MKSLSVLTGLILAVLLQFPLAGSSQNSTFQKVHNLLQATCGGSGCHNGSTATFNVTLSDTAFYNSIVNANPVNPSALSSANKLVKPGDPVRSFLLRKMAHGISDPLDLKQPNEGLDMPYGAAKLPDNEIELVRQWILFGAQFADTLVDTSLINAYYRDGGIDDTYGQRNPPAVGTGVQIYLGRIFVRPASETEYFIKYKPDFGSSTEVTKIESYMPQSSHHFVIYSYSSGADVNFREGLRGLNEGSSDDSHAFVRNPIATGPGLKTYQLPQGTAYFWPENIVFDLNLHIKNTNQDSILATDLYLNVDTQAAGIAEHYMYTRTVPDLTISIPQDGQVHTITAIASDTNEVRNWKIWNIYTHTHKYGVGYEVFLRNSDGTKGDMVYDGNYSYEGNYPVGFYRWGPEVTFKYYPDDSLLDVDPRNGFIHEARFLNTAGPNPVEWGLTSDDEMMVLGIQYILGDSLVSSVNDINEGVNAFVKVYPNPNNGEFTIYYDLKQAGQLEAALYNLVGEQVINLTNGQQPVGSHAQRISTNMLAPGIYILRSTLNGAENIQKIVVSE
jgi:hypothetical protein